MKTRVAGLSSVVVALALVAWLSSYSTTAYAAGCVGECNGDGEVTVNEILAMVNVALGSAAVTVCPPGDADGNGEITVNEILMAVNNALNGCPAGGTPTPTPTATPGTGGTLAEGAAVAGRTTLAIDTVTVISNVVAAFAVGLRPAGSAAEFSLAAPDLASPDMPGGEAAGACPLGGTATSTGNPILGQRVTLTGCKAATFDGSVTFDGSLSFGLFAPLSIDVTATFRDTNGMEIETATADATGSVSPTLGGGCYLTGATLTLTGMLSTSKPNGPTVGLNFTNTTVTIDNITFNASCVPIVYNLTLNGAAALHDPNGGVQNVTFNQLVVHIDASGSSTLVIINGGIQSPCFGGTATLMTQIELNVPSGENCPTAGTINVTLTNGQAQITFQPDGSVIVQSGGNMLTAPNCLDPRLLMCAA